MSDEPEFSEPEFSKERGDTFREVADIIRGMVRIQAFKMEDLPAFFDDQAKANDFFLADRTLARTLTRDDRR
jgi:hypothetical protein